jgi:lysophospholipid acyltransferase (LPLAT)-like uncharacterized protein
LNKKILRSVAGAVIPFLGALLIRFLYITNKKEYYGPESIGDGPIIIACWHNDLLMYQYSYKYYRKNPRVKALISEHFDGDLIANTMKYFSIGSVRGSSTRGGAKALITCLKELRAGNDIGITPDGPKGPRHEIASEGIIILAQKTDAKIVLVSVKPTKYWELKSWDKFIVPKPFGTIKFYIDDTMDVKGMSLDGAKEYLKMGLLNHEL